MKSLFYTKIGLQRLNKSFDYIKKNNSYYSQFNEGNFFNNYNNLPYIQKQDIKKVGDTFYTKNCESKILFEYTSGSTGIPLKCYKTLQERSVLSRYIWKNRFSIDPLVSTKNFIELLGVNSYREIDFTDISQNNILKIFKYFNEKKPRWICLSPTMAYSYALFAEKINYHCDSLMYMELQGEYIGLEKRKYIEKVFKIKTILQYGLRETWTIASECPHGYLRIWSDLYLIEQNVPEGEYGEIILSSNINKYMPILKYKTGDIGKINYNTDCECAKRNPYTIELFEGRAANYIKGHDNLIADIVFKRIIKKSLKTLEYNDNIIIAAQVIQTDINSFVYNIVPGNNYDKRIEQEIISFTNFYFKEHVSISFNYNHSVLLNKSGKNKFYTCNF